MCFLQFVLIYQSFAIILLLCQGDTDYFLNWNTLKVSTNSAARGILKISYKVSQRYEIIGNDWTLSMNLIIHDLGLPIFEWYLKKI